MCVSVPSQIRLGAGWKIVHVASPRRRIGLHARILPLPTPGQRLGTRHPVAILPQPTRDGHRPFALDVRRAKRYSLQVAPRRWRVDRLRLKKFQGFNKLDSKLTKLAEVISPVHLLGMKSLRLTLLAVLLTLPAPAVLATKTGAGS